MAVRPASQRAADAGRPLLSADLRVAYEKKLPEGLRQYRDWTETSDYFRDALRSRRSCARAESRQRSPVAR